MGQSPCNKLWISIKESSYSYILGLGISSRGINQKEEKEIIIGETVLEGLWKIKASLKGEVKWRLL